MNAFDKTFVDENLKKNNPFIDHISVSGNPDYFFVRFDALKKEDYPHNIDRNSIYITFTIDNNKSTIELHSYGHIYLSDEEMKSSYLCMKSMIDCYKSYGGKKFRKQSFKTMQQAFEKMNDYFKAVMESVEKYTGGYPYKKGLN